MVNLLSSIIALKQINIMSVKSDENETFGYLKEVKMKLSEKK